MKINIFVIHWQKLEQRKVMIETMKKKLLDSLGDINLEYITEYEPEEINPRFLDIYINTKPFEQNEKYNEYNKFMQMFTTRDISNIMKHMVAWEKILDTDDDTINFVIEDDTYFPETFVNNIKKIYNELPKDYNMIFLCQPNNEKNVREPYISNFDIGSNRNLISTDSYIISKKMAEKLLDEYRMEVRFHNNIQMTYVIEKEKLKIYQVIPNIVVEASKYGVYNSSMVTNNVLIYNNDYMNLYNMIMTKNDISNSKIIESLFENNTLRNNPDFLSLEGIYYFKKENYQKAKECFDKAYKIYNDNNGLINRTSLFLTYYIDLFKFL